MKGPEEIYVLHYDTPLSNGQVGSAWDKEIGLKNESRYVRSDVAELNWEDISEIREILEEMFWSEHFRCLDEVEFYSKVADKFNRWRKDR